MSRASSVNAVLILLLIAASGNAATQQPKTRAVSYPSFGFTVYVPQTSVRETIAAEEPVKLCEAFRYGNLVYLVKVTGVPEDMLAATAIEKTLQSLTAPGGSLAGARRWEIEIGDTLFKGLSGSYDVDQSLPEALFIKRALGGKEAHCCMAMAPLKDRFSPIVELWLVGPVSRALEIDDLGRFFVYKFANTTTKPTEAAAGAVSEVKQTDKRVTAGATLKKGDIELVGSVEYIDPSSKSFTMVVERIRLPSTGYITLDPPRRKLVYLRRPLPANITVDSRVRIIGFNTGIGKPMTADVVEPM